MAWAGPLAAAVFAATFLLLATGRLAHVALPRGPVALAGGVATALLLRVHPRAIDADVIVLIVTLTALAAFVELSGGFAGLRRTLARASPRTSLAGCVLVVAATSALLLNDSAVVVLVPLLLPSLQARGLPAVPTVALLAVAANVGSLLTPFGNPQNAILAEAAALSAWDMLRVQALPVALGLVALLAACALVRTAPATAPEPVAQVSLGRGRAWAAAAAFLVLAVVRPASVPLGWLALACAVASWAALRPLHGGQADRAAVRAVDPNVVALFVGLYLLTAGIPAWLPGFALADLLDGAVAATVGVGVASNVLGNVPAILAALRIDPAWTVAHAAFLMATSTLGGALFLTGSAASLLAADKARAVGVEVTFWGFALVAVPCMLPVLAAAAWLTW